MRNSDTKINPENNHQFYRPDNIPVNSDNLLTGRGDISFKGDLQIDGVFSGKINVAGNLTVGQNARITGEVEVTDLILFGYMVGNARVENLAVLHPASVFSGTLTAREAEFYTGSRITGKRIVGRVTELEAVISNKNIVYNKEEPVLVPEQAASPKIKF